MLGAGCADGTPVRTTGRSNHGHDRCDIDSEPAITDTSCIGTTTTTTKAGWNQAAPMPRERAGFDAVLMGDGAVLVGDDDDPSSDLGCARERARGRVRPRN